MEPANGRGWAIHFRAYGKRRDVVLGTTENGRTASEPRSSSATRSRR